MSLNVDTDVMILLILCVILRFYMHFVVFNVTITCTSGPLLHLWAHMSSEIKNNVKIFTRYHPTGDRGSPSGGGGGTHVSGLGPYSEDPAGGATKK